MKNPIPIHPLAAVFPMMPPDSHEFLELVDDIKEVGLIDPIVLEGEVLIDGRNRLAACERAGVTPRFIQFKDIPKPREFPKGQGGQDSEVAEWILSKNVMRRNMTDDQRTMAWTEFDRVEAELRAADAKKASTFKPGNAGGPGGDRKSEKVKSTVALNSEPPQQRDYKAKNENSTAGKIAKAAGVSRHKAGQAVALSKAAEEIPALAQLVDAVKAGTVKLKDANKVLVETKRAINPPKPAAKKAAELTVEQLFEKQWAKFLKPFAVPQHTLLRELIHTKLESPAL